MNAVSEGALQMSDSRVLELNVYELGAGTRATELGTFPPRRGPDSPWRTTADRECQRVRELLI